MLSSKSECQIYPVYTKSPINLDGLLNETDWKNVKPVSDFTQRELKEGAAPTEKTEVRILYDEDNLYIGVMCFDSEPDKIIHKELKWDGELESDDMFTVVFDTYNDKRTGLNFSVNPNGAQYDATFESGDMRIGDDWNGIWDTSARIMDYGWSCEIAIPFKTLRYPNSETQTWGINFMRKIRRKNEEVLWRSWTRNDGIKRLAKVGTIHIDRPLGKSNELDIKPYILTGAEREINNDVDDVLKYGLDVRYGITSNTTLHLTTKTDFAQIEDDREVINLTRFNISYPEKRDFFLEGAETFDFNFGRENLFYSRKIGITPDRKQVPILGGAKLIQKSGSYRMGLITMQTDEKDGYPSTNYTVFRVKKDVLKQSYIGFMATSLYDTDHHDNQFYGLDFEYKSDTFLNNKNFEVSGILAGTMTDGSEHDNMAGRFGISYPNDLISSFLGYQMVGENFNPEIGFLRRNDFKEFYWYLRISPRPNIPHIKQLVFQPFFFSYYTDMNGKLITRDVEISPLGFNLNSDDEFEFNINNNYEYIEENFNIFKDVVIPPGVYEWWSYEVKYEGSKTRPVSFDSSAEWGDFYNGYRRTFEVECTYKKSKNYSLSADVEYNNITINDNRFDTKEYGGRLVVDLTTRLSSSTFVQWNNETKEVNVNFRIHYIPKIGSDVYLVYNHLMDEEDDFRTLQNTGMLKINYTYRF